MKIAVRADASSEIGTGHLRRCLSIAETLKDLGADLYFVTRRHDAVAEHVMATADYSLSLLHDGDGIVEAVGDAPHAALARVSWQCDAAETIAALKDWAPEWVIVDHYAFDTRWHDAVRSALGCSILVVDDLGDRSLSANILLDGNAAESQADKYVGLIARHTRTLLGPRFAPLSSSYRTAPGYAFSSDVRSIGVFMGGTDAEGVSVKVIEALRGDAGFCGSIEVVSTSANRHLEALARYCSAADNIRLSIDLPELSAFYARHDIQIGAGGTASYERCCIGAPTVAVVVASNQLMVVPVLDAIGVVRGATIPGVEATTLLPDASPLGTVVRQLIDKPEQRLALSEESRRYVDGRGSERVALSILADQIALRRATMEDAALLHAWRNDPATRAVSITTDEISFEDHIHWLTKALTTSRRILRIAMIGGKPVGVIRFDLLDNGAWEVSLYMDPGLHGLGLGRRMLLIGEDAVLEDVGKPAEFHAQVVPGNRVSMRLFEGAGYQGRGDRLVKIQRQRNVA